jgi:hypothetical protein
MLHFEAKIQSMATKLSLLQMLYSISNLLTENCSYAEIQDDRRPVFLQYLNQVNNEDEKNEMGM